MGSGGDSSDRPGAIRRLAGGVALLLSAGGVFYAGWIAGRLLLIARGLLVAEDPSSAVRRPFRFRNTLDGPIHDGFGLTFIGVPGAAWAIAQAALLAGLVVLCFAGSRRVRRIASVLTPLAGSLWFANTLHLAVEWDPMHFFDDLVFHVPGFTLLSAFALVRWRAG